MKSIKLTAYSKIGDGLLVGSFPVDMDNESLVRNIQVLSRLKNVVIESHCPTGEALVGPAKDPKALIDQIWKP